MAKHLNGNAGGTGSPGSKAVCDQLIDLVLNQRQWQLWHYDDKPYVSFVIDGRQQTHKLDSPRTKRPLRHDFRKRFGRTPNNTALTDAIAMLEAMAFAEGWERPIRVRVAKHETVTYIDLGDQSWRIVRIDMHGWKVIEAADAPVVFVRSKAMRRCLSHEVTAVWTLS